MNRTYKPGENIYPCRRIPLQRLAFARRLILTVIASSICSMFGSFPVNAAEPLTSLDKKSFKTTPFDPAPPEAQRRELERVVALCVKTVETELPDGHFKATVDGGIVNSLGIDRERFKFWKCMLESGHPLTPINK